MNPLLLLFLLLFFSYQTSDAFKRHHLSRTLPGNHPHVSSSGSSDSISCCINDIGFRRGKISGRLYMENEGGNEEPQEESIEELMKRAAAEEDAERQANAQADLERKLKAKKAK